MNYGKPFSMKEERNHIPKEKTDVKKCQRRHPFLAFLSLCPYILLTITFYEGSMVEKCMYGPINKSCLIYLSHSNLII
jgi:hypothetical protein